MKIGFAKLGRAMSLTLDSCGFVGGDNEPVSTLIELARARPDDQFYVIGRNSGEDPAQVGLPPNVFNPWLDWEQPVKRWMKQNPDDLSIAWKKKYLLDLHDNLTAPFIKDLDAIVLWVGQHGTSNTPLPVVGFRHQDTSPFISFLHYVGYLIRGVNAWRDLDPIAREPIFLNSDPRNTLKMRDLRWPLMHPVLTQYNYTSNIKHERGNDPEPPEKPWSGWTRKCAEGWCSEVEHAYAQLEVCGVLPGTPVGNMLNYDETYDDRQHLGLFINEARWYSKPGLNRLEIMRDWVMPLQPTFIHGEWHPYSWKKLGQRIEPARFETFNDKYHSVLATFTTPSSGSGWATTKPWEAFACGTVCFYHPRYDDQDNTLKNADAALIEFLRVKTPAELADRIDTLKHDRAWWVSVVRAQRALFDKAVCDKVWLRRVEERLDD